MMNMMKKIMPKWSKWSLSDKIQIGSMGFLFAGCLLYSGIETAYKKICDAVFDYKIKTYVISYIPEQSVTPNDAFCEERFEKYFPELLNESHANLVRKTFKKITERKKRIKESTPSYADLYDMNHIHLVKINLLLDALEQNKNKKAIEAIIDNDFNDKYSEHGGNVEFSDDLATILNFKEIPSSDSHLKDKRNNESYSNNNKKYIFCDFHLHAAYCSQKQDTAPSYAYPSKYNFKRTKISIGVFSGDLNSAALTGVDGLVICPFKTGYNAVFYTSSGKIINLGKYQYKE